MSRKNIGRVLFELRGVASQLHPSELLTLAEGVGSPQQQRLAWVKLCDLLQWTTVPQWMPHRDNHRK